MPSYDWREYAHRGLYNRFPIDALGASTWAEEIPLLIPGFETAPTRLMEQRAVRPQPRNPCVFISHRQADDQQARRIAFLAHQEGFNYWLDVLDPSLTGLPPESDARIVAAIIEMALLNSTHVIAVMTGNTKGSEWVPYEYGRVKDPVPNSPQAACWISSALSNLPEYLYLGAILKTEQEISAWLKNHKGSYSLIPSFSRRWTATLGIPPHL